MTKLSRPLRLLIVQPYLPSYHVPFFDRLIPRLAVDGIQCRVAIPSTPLTQLDRKDNADAPWTLHTRARNFEVGGRSFSMYGSASARRGADAVITGLASTSVDTWAALYANFRRIPIGLWGHVRNYVSPPSALDQRLKRIQARRADHIFAYTPQGALEAQRWGVPADRVTCVMNTVDTDAIIAAQQQLTAEQIHSFQDQHGLLPGRTTAFIGALDASKRIDFLAEVLDDLWRSDPTFKILLGGHGDCHHLLAPAIARGQAVDMGYATPAAKALISACASTICMPGRIGLVAIDALALKLPVITTDWPFHAPEVDYLDHGHSLFTTTDAEFASVLRHHTRHWGTTAPATTDPPLLTDMVLRFHQGVRRMLQVPTVDHQSNGNQARSTTLEDRTTAHDEEN